ncbi:MAG: hypothetical protein Q8Q48_02655 [Candidatus Staskawiczbacteria bacterium]|nr:hypothetical protein [Candidatus Staskawiczbacteria bacterium]
MDESNKNKEGNKKIILFALAILLVASVSFLAGQYAKDGKKSGSDVAGSSQSAGQQPQASQDTQALTAKVLPQEGVEIPAVWGDLGKQLTNAGVIDEDAFKSIYSQRGGLSAEEEKILSGSGNGKIKITQDNANFILNMLWALGLGNKNDILDNGEMANPQYGGAGGFASTGGWTLAKGNAMSYYSKFKFITLTASQQALVDKVSKNIYRPCCGNSTHFPDCNHGMAMLGLLELMASQGVGEQDMYKAALAVNSYWFPDTYLTIASYFKDQGTDWSSVDAKTALGAEYSSSSGYQQVLRKTQPQSAPSGGGGCGV